MAISFIVTATLFILLVFLLLLKSRVRKIYPAKSVFGKSPAKDRKKIDPSYLLLSPYIACDNFEKKGRVYLVDLYGRVVHQWKAQFQTFYAILKRNGNLVATSVIPRNLVQDPGGGQTGCIFELDWRGKKVWEYRNPAIHHDFEVLPSGNIVALMNEKVSEGFAKRVKGGIPNSEFQEAVWSDCIIEIDRRTKNIVWKWKSCEWLDPAEHSLNEFTPRSELTHSNSIRHVERDPFYGEESFLISMRHINTVALVRKRDGKIIWKSPPKMFSYQHDATLLENGNILAFDNGLFRLQKRPFLWSRVIEVDPRENKIVWEFNGGETGSERARFASSILGGAQRLENGNTMIVDGLRGHLFEVAKNKKIVWDFINPRFTYSTGAWRNNTIFKARRYRKDEIKWPEKLPSPLPLAPHIFEKFDF